MFPLPLRTDHKRSSELPYKPVATMLQYRLYGGNSLPAGLEGFVKAGANIGSVIGQFAFGASSVRLLSWVA